MNIVVVGSKGTLGLELARSWNDRRVEERIAANLGVAPVDEQDRVISLNIPDFDVCSRASAIGTICDFEPDVILNASGVNLIDWLETRPNTARTLHEHGPANLREAAKRSGALLVQYSCGEVFYRSRLERGAVDERENVATPEEARSRVKAFDDESELDLPVDPDAPGFDETTVPNPASVYAKTKVESERVASEAPESLIIRFSSLFGETTEYSSGNLIGSLLNAFGRTSRVSAISDRMIEPLWSVDVLCATKTLIRCDARGLYHLTGNSRGTLEDVARYLLEKTGLRGRSVSGVTTKEYGVTAPHSAFTILRSARCDQLDGLYRVPDWRTAVTDFLDWRQNYGSAIVK